MTAPTATLHPLTLVLMCFCGSWCGAGRAQPNASEAKPALQPAASSEQPVSDPSPRFRVRTLRGRVVWLAESLARRHGVRIVPEALERVIALETSEGTLHPIIEDIRGRAFRRDKRLRGTEMELLVRQHEGSPMVQVIKLFAVEKNAKYELDYWCEICSIAMFELKECDCCQGPIELRRQRVPAAR